MLENNLSQLTAIGPVDGRYRGATAALAPYFSEWGLIKYRVLVEIEYLLFLAQIPLPQLAGKISQEQEQAMRKIYLQFSEGDAQWIKDIEKVTNHDVKAVEYFVKEKLKNLELDSITEFVHFGLTSQDINNTAIPLSLKEGVFNVLLPKLEGLILQLSTQAQQWQDITMLARTHGQPASPTRLGKEWMVFVERLEKQTEQLRNIKLSAKFGGATGNFNAHAVAYPDMNWPDLADLFVSHTLELSRSYYTTQIDHYDQIAAFFHALERINTILIDLSRDVWSYISMDYFKQKLKAGEIGSSAMPHKVNPIDFENAEGNLGMANALFHFLAAKLPISRLQRDLTDSTVLRNIGVPLAHSCIAYTAIEKGLNKLILNHEAINHDLENNWAVVAEGIQTILRREGFEKPYEALKELTRTNQKVTKQSISQFIDNLALSPEVKAELKALSPHNYYGMV